MTLLPWGQKLEKSKILPLSDAMFGKRKNTKELPESPFCYKEDGTTLNLSFDIGQNLRNWLRFRDLKIWWYWDSLLSWFTKIPIAINLPNLWDIGFIFEIQPYFNLYKIFNNIISMTNSCIFHLSSAPSKGGEVGLNNWIQIIIFEFHIQEKSKSFYAPLH